MIVNGNLSINCVESAHFQNKAATIDVRPSKCEKIRYERWSYLSDHNIVRIFQRFNARSLTHSIEWSGNFLDAPVMILSTLFIHSTNCSKLFNLRNPKQWIAHRDGIFLCFDNEFREKKERESEKKSQRNATKSWKTFKNLNHTKIATHS